MLEIVLIEMIPELEVESLVMSIKPVGRVALERLGADEASTSPAGEGGAGRTEGTPILGRSDLYSRHPT